jgi:hypothetical protein
VGERERGGGVSGRRVCKEEQEGSTNLPNDQMPNVARGEQKHTRACPCMARGYTLREPLVGLGGLVF